MSKSWWCPTILSASLSSHCNGEGAQQLLGKAGSLLAQWMWFLHSFWWTSASLHLKSLTNLLLVSSGRLSACPTRKRQEEQKFAMVAGVGAATCYPRDLFCAAYVTDHISPSHFPMLIYACLTTAVSVHILTFTIPTVPVKNQFPHPPVLTTPARSLALFFSFFLLGFFHHLCVSKGRWHLRLCLIHSRGNSCACF